MTWRVLIPWGCAVTLIILVLSGCEGEAVTPPYINPDDVEKMAVYFATTGTDDLTEAQVNFNITDATTIKLLLDTIPSDQTEDGSMYLADNNGYIYIKFKNGAFNIYHIYLDWARFCGKDLRTTSYFISETGQTLWPSYAQ